MSLDLTVDKSTIFLFDYGPAEWQAIERTAPRTLSEDDRAYLCRSAGEYLLARAERDAKKRVSSKNGMRLFKQAARLITELSTTLEKAARVRSVAVLIPRELSARFVRSLLPFPGQSKAVDGMRRRSGIVSNAELIDLLAVFRDECERLAAPLAWKPSLFMSFTGRLDPSVVYYQRILILWADLGGKLDFKRRKDDRTGVIGPLPDYFFAVVRPVMGKRAPASESLPDIIKRQKRFEAYRAAVTRYASSYDIDEFVRELKQIEPRLVAEAQGLHGAMERIAEGLKGASGTPEEIADAVVAFRQLLKRASHAARREGSSGHAEPKRPT